MEREHEKEIERIQNEMRTLLTGYTQREERTSALADEMVTTEKNIVSLMEKNNALEMEIKEIKENRNEQVEQIEMRYSALADEMVKMNKNIASLKEQNKALEKENKEYDEICNQFATQFEILSKSAK